VNRGMEIAASETRMTASQVSSGTPAGVKIYSSGGRPLHVLRPAEGRYVWLDYCNALL